MIQILSISKIFPFFIKKFVKTCSVYIYALCIFATNINAQKSFEFKHLQEKEGITNFVINCFEKDKFGYLWIGTFDGLYRYDGSHFLHFKKNSTNKNSLQNNVVHDLAADKEGNIWYATRFGIGCYYIKTNRFENFENINGRRIGVVLNVLCDRDGNIWFSTYDGLYSLNTKDKSSQFFINDYAGSSPDIIYIQKNGAIEDPYKRGIWLACVDGLKYFDITQKKFYYYKNNPKNLPFFKKDLTSAISLNPKKQLVYGSSYNEITILDTQTLKVIKQIKFTDAEVNKNNEFSTTFTDSEENIWVSTWLYRNFYIDSKTQKITQFAYSEEDKTSVAGDFFWCGWQDEEGTVFLGTINGISYINPKKQFFKVHEIAKKIPDVIRDNDNINFFVEESEQKWIFGTKSHGFFSYNPLTTEYKKYDSQSKNRILKKHNNIFYLGSDKGIYTYDLNLKKIGEIRQPTIVETKQTEICDIEIESDSIIWFANSGMYVMRYNKNTKQITPFDVIQDKKSDYRYKYYPQITIDKNKDIWVNAYNKGILKFSKEKQRFVLLMPFFNGNFESRTLKSVFDKYNNLWIPFSGKGLMKYEPKANNYTIWTENEGLNTELLHTTCIDNYGKIWTAAYNEISIFNPSSGNFQNFHIPVSESNYQYDNQFNKLKNGNIISLMKGSLVEFYPERLLKKSLKNEPLINQLILTDTLINVTKNAEIRLNVSQNSFNIIFGYLPLNLQNPHKYMYKLEGFNKDWVNNEHEVYANFANLSGGDYVFKVKASNGEFESKIAQITIHIDTIFYKTWWFITLISALFLALIYAFYRFRLNQAARFHQMQVLTSALEKDKTEIQYQNLINHLNPHFLFNSLTSLNSLISISPIQASSFLEKLSLIYRYILQNKEKEWVTLTQELDFVQHYIDLQKSRFEDGLQININISEEHFNRNIVPVTIQNLIENAIKHNIIDEDQPLVIHIFVEEDFLFVKNNLQKKHFVETSNKQGLDSLKNLYKYLVTKPLEITETKDEFLVKVPLF